MFIFCTSIISRYQDTHYQTILNIFLFFVFYILVLPPHSLLFHVFCFFFSRTSLYSSFYARVCVLVPISYATYLPFLWNFQLHYPGNSLNSFLFNILQHNYNVLFDLRTRFMFWSPNQSNGMEIILCAKLSRYGTRCARTHILISLCFLSSDVLKIF